MREFLKIIRDYPAESGAIIGLIMFLSAMFITYKLIKDKQ